MWGTALKKTSAGDVGTDLKNLALSGWRVMTVGDVDTALKKTSAGDLGTPRKKKSLCGWRVMVVGDVVDSPEQETVLVEGDGGG